MSTNGSESPIKILKPESQFTKKNLSSRGSAKNMKFADEIGEDLSTNNFVEQLHYSASSFDPEDGPKSGCHCIIS